MKKWSKEEILLLPIIGPHLRQMDTANIINVLYENNRTTKGVSRKLEKLKIGNSGFNLDKAITAVNKSKQLSTDTKDAINEMLLNLNEESLNEVTMMNVEGNYATIEKNSDKSPHTIEELISICKIDTNVWAVDKYTVNVREQQFKTKSGHKTVPLYHIKAWVIRKAPTVFEWPSIQPIVSNFAPIKKTVSKKSGHKKALIIPDSQNSYRRNIQTGHLEPTHDRLAWDLVCQVAEEEKPEIIVLLGDMLDLPDWSDKFLVTSDLYFTTQPALLELHWWLRRLAATGAEIVYLEGNHEDRLTRAVSKNIMAAYQIRPANAPVAPPALSIDNLLGLQELGIQYLAPYRIAEYWLNDNLRISHGTVVKSGSGNTVASVVRDARCSEIFGHIHRVEMASKTVWGKSGAKQYVVASPGTISRIDPGIVPSGSGKQNWQQGFSMVEFEDGNGLFDVRLVQIIQGKSIYNGKLWKGIDRTKEIAKDTKWNAFLL